jgi:hypothetical protein
MSDRRPQLNFLPVVVTIITLVTVAIGPRRLAAGSA